MNSKSETEGRTFQIFRVVISFFKFKFQYSMHFYFRTKFNYTQAVMP